VIRLGDKASLFDTRLTRQLDAAALKCSKKFRGFKVQRRIMDGGTCEATVFNLYQIPCTGMAVPLGNYHNQRKDDRPGPEYIDLRDVERGVRLCTAFFENRALHIDPMATLDLKLRKEFRRDSHLLNHRVDYTHARKRKP
jgi:endoglucanase